MVPKNPLTRESVLKAAVALADEEGIASLSMRKLGQRLGVEAMSLYNHVGNKDDMLAGIVDMVVAEFDLPTNQLDWQVAMRFVTNAVRAALLRHPWAATLIESQVMPSQVRFKRAETVIGTLRRAGFSIELAYKAQLTINSYVYGFVQQEINWPFTPVEQSDVAAMLGPQVPADEYPYLTEMLSSIINTRFRGQGESETDAYESDFGFGLDLLLDGLERIRLESLQTSKTTDS
jgi:AcrR family transcriptional regulator